jgi:hypothetical protein
MWRVTMIAVSQPNITANAGSFTKTFKVQLPITKILSKRINSSGEHTLHSISRMFPKKSQSIGGVNQ